MHLQGTKPWTSAATAYSAVRATLLAAATLFVATSGYVITSDLPTIHSGSPRDRRRWGLLCRVYGVKWLART